MSFSQLINKVQTQLIAPLVSLLFVLATVLFLYGVTIYVIGSYGDPKKLDQGKKAMLWGIIGLFVMSAAWAIVQLICNFFGVYCSGGSGPNLISV